MQDAHVAFCILTDPIYPTNVGHRTVKRNVHKSVTKSGHIHKYDEVTMEILLEAASQAHKKTFKKKHNLYINHT